MHLVHEFTCHVSCGSQFKVGAGPYGDRQCYELTDGHVDGPRLTGKLIGSGMDWMLVGPDGFLRMDVRIQFETNDGALVCAHYFGLAETNETLTQAVTACVPTAFSDKSIRSHWLLETGDDRYAWVNRSVFVGEGRVLPAASTQLGFEHRVYRAE